jgi:hypothetical protein
MRMRALAIIGLVGLTALSACESERPATRAGAALDRAGTATGNAVDNAAQATGNAANRTGNYIDRQVNGPNSSNTPGATNPPR